MIKRIVKMTFHPEEVQNFLILFDSVHSLIENFEGCQEVKLYAEAGADNVLFTLSLWDSEESLEQYRSSELFKETWSKTKMLFCEKPSAWSIKQIR